MPEIDRRLPAVVFIHGIGGGARLWALQMTSFSAAGYRPVALDLPGYGERPAVDHLDFEGLAVDVEAAIERLGLARPALVGHSLGGMVVQTALRRRPDGYEAAVLVCTSAAFGSKTGDFQKKFVADRLAPLEAGQTMAHVARIVVGAMGPNPDAHGRALAVATIAATAERTYRAAVHCLVGFDERANLAAIKIPVLCVAAAHDPLAPPSGIERMAGKIPHARYVCLSGVGHFANLEAPAAFDAALFEFLGRLPPRRPSEQDQ
ncbi:MAG TPA: alpha/beta hydrolase [Xanthobacteraceae bacterium]|nr:alpha/beta hydrolase [Xanthobacteraceae bacterium]